MYSPQAKQALVIVGAGPAGLAPLFAAASAGKLHELLQAGVTILERGPTVGAGSLGHHGIQSDSTAASLVDILLHSEHPRLTALQSHPLTVALLALGKQSAPLTMVGRFLHLAGTVLCELVAESPRGCVLTGVMALWVRQGLQGGWSVRYATAGGSFAEVEAHSVLLACGADQPLERILGEHVAGVPLAEYAAKLLPSGQILAMDGTERLKLWLKGKNHPKIAVIGGSTSAAAVAWTALNRLPKGTFGAGGITILHRSPLHVFYDSVAEALADAYTDFTESDVCRLTGRVHRFAGFRLDSRELMMRALGVGGRDPEPRLQLLPLKQESNSHVQQVLDEADLVVAALGYRPRLLPVFMGDMTPLPLYTPQQQRWSVVDPASRVMTETGDSLPGLYAIGLAAGPGAQPQFGGEAGFRGQINSLWIWQHIIGKSITEQVLASISSSAFFSSGYGTSMLCPSGFGMESRSQAGASLTIASAA